MGRQRPPNSYGKRRTAQAHLFPRRREKKKKRHGSRSHSIFESGPSAEKKEERGPGSREIQKRTGSNEACFSLDHSAQGGGKKKKKKKRERSPRLDRKGGELELLFSPSGERKKKRGKPACKLEKKKSQRNRSELLSSRKGLTNAGGGREKALISVRNASKKKRGEFFMSIIRKQGGKKRGKREGPSSIEGIKEREESEA